MNEELSEDYLAILKVMKERGGTDCTGNCRIRRPGEFHCIEIAEMLGMSASGVRKRIADLLRMGMLELNRLDKGVVAGVTKHTVSPAGQEALDKWYERKLQEKGGDQ
jgi:predicted ArsR family transcriptional regulator